MQANKLKYTLGADSDLVVGEVIEENGGHVIHIRTHNAEKGVALQPILAQSVGQLHVSVTKLDGSPYIAGIPPPHTPADFVQLATRALRGNPNFISAKELSGQSAAGLIFTKSVIQFSGASGIGEPPFTLFNGIVADVFKDVLSSHKVAVLYGTAP